MNGRKRTPPGETRDEQPRPAPLPGKSPSDGDRFADLVGDAKRIDPGPPRVADRISARRGAPADPTKAGTAPAFHWPDPENRHLAAAPGVSGQQLTRLRHGEPEPEEQIDLHGTRLAEAKRILAQRVESAHARGLRCLVIVHGVGKRSPTNEAVLRDAMPDWLTRGALARQVLAFAPAPRRLGGDGATLVLLRKG